LYNDILLLNICMLVSKCCDSFSVPYELSMGGSNEPWAVAFLAQMQTKWAKCKPTWRSLKMEVSECYPQAIVL
jgi:hypothetical protein